MLHSFNGRFILFTELIMKMEGDTRGSARGGDGSAKKDGFQPDPNAQLAHQGSFSQSMNYESSQRKEEQNQEDEEDEYYQRGPAIYMYKDVHHREGTGWVHETGKRNYGFSMQPPAQELMARDLHDQTWTFRHIYRGQPKRHLLTMGWSVFVSSKRLFAGDFVLFIRYKKDDW